jgi:hypothetical protein
MLKRFEKKHKVKKEREKKLNTGASSSNNSIKVNSFKRLNFLPL